MIKLFLALLICLFCVTPAWPLTKIIDLPLATDLVDDVGTLAAGEIKRVSGRTCITGGVLSTKDGDDTPFSNASVEDETGATEMRGSFVDGQAWFHDAGSLIAAYAGTGNLFIGLSGTKHVYGFLGEVGTGLVATALANNVTAISDADPGVVSSVAHGLVIGDLVFFDSLNEMTELNDAYQTVTAVGSADLFSIGDTSGYAAETTGGACAHEVTEPAATAVHIYKEHLLTNEGWNAIDTGIDYNADTDWDFDVYVNLMTATGSTAQACYEDGWLSIEPEGTNLVLYSEDFSKWAPTRLGYDTSEDDPRGATGATGLVSSSDVDSSHSMTLSVRLADNADVTYSVFVKPGDKTWLRLQMLTKAGDYPYCHFNLSEAGSVGINNTTKESIIRLGTTDWYRCSITHNIGTGANLPRMYVYMAEGDNDISFTGDAATIDTYVYGTQAEQTLFMTSYIPTNGMPVTRTTEAGDAADNGYSWTITQPLRNILDDAEPVASPTDSQGTLLFDVKWGCDESDIAAAGHSLIGIRNSEYSIGYFDHNRFYTADGTNISDLVHPAFSAGDIITYDSRWGDVDGNANDMSAGLREEGSAWSFDETPADYDGDFTLGTDLRLSFSNLYPIHIRKIRFWDEPFLSDGPEFVYPLRGPHSLGLGMTFH